MGNLRFGIIAGCYTNPETHQRTMVYHVRHRIPGRPTTSTRPKTHITYGPRIAAFRTRLEAMKARDLYQERWKQRLPIEPEPDAVALMELCYRMKEK